MRAGRDGSGGETGANIVARLTDGDVDCGSETVECASAVRPAAHATATTATTASGRMCGESVMAGGDVRWQEVGGWRNARARVERGEELGGGRDVGAAGSGLEMG